MGMAAEILALREHRFSSVSELLSALELVYEAPVDKISTRVFMASKAADLVLTNVAAHAADAMNDQTVIRKGRRVAPQPRRKNRRFDSGAHPRQRILFGAN